MGSQGITYDDTRREICTQAASYAQIFDRVPVEIVRDEWIRDIMLHKLQNRKKLCLVLDLDHTLLHTKLVDQLSSQEKTCLRNTSQKDDIFRWGSMGVDYLTKLRPFVRNLLKKASKRFDMYIYTNGSRDYATKMARLLDPDRVYFGSRIISKEDSTVKGQKGLDIVPVHKSGVLILDDTDKVWARDLGNLVVIKPYRYFAPKHPNTTRSLLDEGKDERKSSGPLSRALRLLKEVHRLYFQCNHVLDVDKFLGILRKDNGNHEEKLQQLQTGNSWCDMGSPKRLRVNDECSSPDVTKRQRC